jgi:hypothetical protein
VLEPPNASVAPKRSAPAIARLFRSDLLKDQTPNGGM